MQRGECGTQKPLTCSASQLAKVAQMRSDDESGMERLLGERRAQRFASAFLDVLRGAG